MYETTDSLGYASIAALAGINPAGMPWYRRQFSEGQPNYNQLEWQPGKYCPKSLQR